MYGVRYECIILRVEIVELTPVENEWVWFLFFFLFCSYSPNRFRSVEIVSGSPEWNLGRRVGWDKASKKPGKRYDIYESWRSERGVRERETSWGRDENVVWPLNCTLNLSRTGNGGRPREILLDCRRFSRRSSHVLFRPGLRDGCNVTITTTIIIIIIRARNLMA